MGLNSRVRWWDDQEEDHITYYSKEHDETPVNKRISYAILGIQRALLGQDCKLYLTGKYDETTRRAVAYFQGTKTGKTVPETGIFDKRTAKELFSRYATFFEKVHEIPDRILRGYSAAEGVWDSGAIGSNLKDLGLMQINTGEGVHKPPISWRSATNPMFAYPWAADRLVGRYLGLERNWRAAILGHRSPLWAECYIGRRKWPDGWYDELKKITFSDEAEKYINGILTAGLK